MDQFLNPLFLIRVLKSYLTDVDRIWHINKEELRKYQDKALKRVVKYAYDVPLYHDKYRKQGIHYNDIKGVGDIQKLPLITKEDLRKYYPNGIVPKSFNKKDGFLLSTSGSTGKPVFVYCDKFSAVKRLIGFVRVLKAYGGNWRKSKTALVIDLAPGTVESATYRESAMPFLKRLISLKNIKYIHIGEKPEGIIKEINEFQPEFLGSDPNMLRELAFLKNNGYGKNINPQCIFSGGSMLDNYTKNYVEESFGTRLLDVYGSTEAGPMAFECLNDGHYHVHSDFVFLEFLDENKKQVPYDKPGNLVVSRLYGEGTPIIRYTGIEDILIPIEKTTNCGITTEMVKKIEGRTADLLILPDGEMLSPLAVTGIPAKIMEDYNTYKIKQFQIIQHKLSEIEILVVIDDKLRKKGASIETILGELKKRFTQEIGHNVNVIITETNEIQKDIRSDYVKVVVSKVKNK